MQHGHYTNKDIYTTHMSSMVSSTLLSSYVLSSVQLKAVSGIISRRLSI